jgi:hypothetical protein
MVRGNFLRTFPTQEEPETIRNNAEKLSKTTFNQKSKNLSITSHESFPLDEPWHPSRGEWSPLYKKIQIDLYFNHYTFKETV